MLLCLLLLPIDHHWPNISGNYFSPVNHAQRTKIKLQNSTIFVSINSNYNILVNNHSCWLLGIKNILWKGNSRRRGRQINSSRGFRLLGSWRIILNLVLLPEGWWISDRNWKIKKIRTTFLLGLTISFPSNFALENFKWTSLWISEVLLVASTDCILTFPLSIGCMGWLLHHLKTWV